MICDNYKYSSVVLAYYIVALMNQRGLEINMTKLQKLLYIAYGTYLAIKNQRLTNEHPQAWPYGPVFPTTRNRLLKKDLSLINLSIPELKDIQKDTEIQSLMMLVLNGFGKKTLRHYLFGRINQVLLGIGLLVKKGLLGGQEFLTNTLRSILIQY